MQLNTDAARIVRLICRKAPIGTRVRVGWRPVWVPSQMWWKFTNGDLRRGEVSGLSGEVNELGWRFRQCLPAIDLAHGDLPGSKQSPEQHGRCLRRR